MYNDQPARQFSTLELIIHRHPQLNWMSMNTNKTSINRMASKGLSTSE
jgi:hypothetical protein